MPQRSTLHAFYLFCLLNLCMAQSQAQGGNMSADEIPTSASPAPIVESRDEETEEATAAKSVVFDSSLTPLTTPRSEPDTEIEEAESESYDVTVAAPAAHALTPDTTLTSEIIVDNEEEESEEADASEPAIAGRPATAVNIPGSTRSRDAAEADTAVALDASSPAAEEVADTGEQVTATEPLISDREEAFLNESKSQIEEQIEAADSDVQQHDEDSPSAFSILGKTVEPGKMKRLHWVASETFYGSNLDTPVYVIHGEKKGLTLCLTAAIHGDELNGVEIVRQLVNGISAADLAGTVIGVPIVNLLGFTRATRYLPDRRDLNRYFPGNSNGSSASRIAASFFEEVIRHCDRLVDFHTGSLNRTNLPQLRANLQIPEVLEFTQNFGSTAVLHSRKLRGNLRSAATQAGIPAVALELGEPGSLQKKQIKAGVRIIQGLMSRLNMTRRHRGRSEPQPVYYSSRWVRVDNGGLLTTQVKVGARIKKGTVLGTIVNPLSNETFEVVSSYNGRLLGMALNQFMLPGYAAFNIGLLAEEPEIIVASEGLECNGNELDAEQMPEEFACVPEESEEIEGFETPTEDTATVEEAELH